MFGVAPASINMDIITMWARLIDLPPECASGQISYDIASSMAPYLMVDKPSRSLLTLSCPRVLVEINVNNKLWDHILVNMGKKEPIIVKLFFEKLPKGFCKHCRILNHPKKKCSASQHIYITMQDTIMEELAEKEENEAFVEDQMQPSKPHQSSCALNHKIFIQEKQVAHKWTRRMLNQLLRKRSY